jgi:hypothetical protein
MPGKLDINEDPNSLPFIIRPEKKTLHRTITTESKGDEFIECHCDGTLQAIANCLTGNNVLFAEIDKQIALLQHEAKTGSGIREKNEIDKLEAIRQVRQQCPSRGLLRIRKTI